MSISPNMSLIIPGVGTTDGPEWAEDLNASLTLIDAHDHSSGYGVPITPSGLNINADLSFGSNNAIAINSARFTAQSSPISGSILDTVYVYGVDLYFNDGSGNQVRITQSGGVAGSPGSISNLTSPATASYVALSSKFVWQSDSNKAADMDGGAVILRNLTANSFGLTLQPPTLSSNYSITLPTVPASSKFMSMDSSGGIGTTWAVDGTTLEVSSNSVQVKDLGITAAKIASGAITATQLSTNINLPGTHPTSASKNLIVSNTNGPDGIAMVRGNFNAGGAGQFGEGFTPSNTGTGTYNVVFTEAFTLPPVVVASQWQVTGAPSFTAMSVIIYGVTASGFSVACQQGSNQALVNTAVQFIALGIRSS